MKDIYTDANSSSLQCSSATQPCKMAGANLSQHFNPNSKASDLYNSSSKTPYQRGSNCLDGKHLSEGSIKLNRLPNFCPIQPSKRLMAPPPINPPFESTIIVENLPSQSRQLKGRRSTQPYLTSSAHFSKLNHPNGKLRSASIANPSRQDDQCSIYHKSPAPSDLNCLIAPTPTSQSLKKEAFPTLNRSGVLEFSCSTVSTDLWWSQLYLSSL